MKRLLALLFALTLFLCGCDFSHAETEPPVPPASASVPSTTVPTAPSVPPQTQPSTPETEPTITVAPETPGPVMVQPEPAASDFVRVLDYLPAARQALAYATENNFTGQPIYEFTDAWLRYGTVKKLMAVSAELEKQGLSLLIWDGFRPVSAQFRLWEVCPDPTYVANPETGYSSHSRGNTIDLTLTDAEGNLREMPTGFDDFSPLADRDYSDCTESARENALLLQNLMEKHGFSGYFGEWWHFSDTDTYPVDENFTPVSPVWRYADCNEFITLRTAPDTAADAITRIPKDGQFQALAECDDFYYVEYQSLRGYVLKGYTAPVQ